MPLHERAQQVDLVGGVELGAQFRAEVGLAVGVGEQGGLAQGCATARRRPRWSELRPLLRPRRVPLDPTERRLAAAASIPDLRLAGAAQGTARGVRLHRRRRRRRAQPAPVAGGVRAGRVPADACCSDVSAVDTSTTILGRASALPLVFAPTGFTRMMHTEGEPAVARAGGPAGIPYALSTMGTTSIERLAAAAPDARRWFQLYLWRDREVSRDFVVAGPGGGLRGAGAHRRHPGRRGRGCATCATA